MCSLQPPTARSTKRLFRFSLRMILVVFTLLCIALGWWVVRAERQKEAVAAVRQAGGKVAYTYEFDSKGYWIKNPKPWTSAWLRSTFGEDLFITLDGAYFDGQIFNDKVLEHPIQKLQRVPSLRWLQVQDSAITDATLGRIAGLTQLRRLLIRSSTEAAPRTKITDKGLAEIRTLRRLDFLSLGKCLIDGSGFEHLETLDRLEEIDLSGTRFNDASARHLRPFTRLRVLCIWETPVTHAAIPEIAHLRNLEELYFGENELTDSAAIGLANLTRLKVLDLDGTKISDAGVQSLRPLSHLQELRLDSTRVVDAQVDVFLKLQDLQVSHTRASDSLLESASRLPELHYLDCCECANLTDAGIKHLEKSKSLEKFSVTGKRTDHRSGISNDALRSLQQARPNLEIHP